jgi:hypothetical protein
MTSQHRATGAEWAEQSRYLKDEADAWPPSTLLDC